MTSTGLRASTIFELRVLGEDGRITDFDPKRIEDSLVRELSMKRETAINITRQTMNRLRNIKTEYLTPPLIREVTCVVLMENGMHTERNKYARVGIPFYDITEMIETNNKDNANLQHNPETIHKHAADIMMKNYMLYSIHPKIAHAHLRGDIHIHDADYFMVRPNCLQHSLPWFFEHGIKVDGIGDHTSVSGPAKNHIVAILHAAKVLASSQTNMAGGQSLDNFNTYVAPYMAGLSYQEVKQAAQCFIFEMNQLYVARGGQTVFSSVNMDFEIPPYLKNVPAIGPGGNKLGTYEDFAEEQQKFTKAFIEVMIEGDAIGKPHLFPNTVFRVRKDTFKKEEQRTMLLEVCKLFAKYGTPYIINLIPEYQHQAVNAMGCRTRLSGDWADHHDIQDPRWSTERCGNLQYVTVNLPRLAYQSNDENTFYEKLDTTCELAIAALIGKHYIIKKRLDNNILPFLAQKIEDETYYRFENLTHTIGFVGLNEAVESLSGYEMHESTDAHKLGLNIIRHMRRIIDDKQRLTGWRWSLTQSPAETTAGRFARLDYIEYKDKAIVRGDKKNPDSLYYTNSSHINVSAQIPLYERALLEGKFHKLCNGGHITHLFLGEETTNPEGLFSLTEKLCENTEIGLFDYAKEITVCRTCNHVAGGIHKFCPRCRSTAVDKYARITGYMQNLNGFNQAKIQEIKERHKY